MMSLTARSQTSAGSAGGLAPAGLLLLGTLPVIAGAFRLEQLSGISDGMPANARFAPMPLPVGPAHRERHCFRYAGAAPVRSWLSAALARLASGGWAPSGRLRTPGGF